MATYLITYDLNSPGQDYRKLLAAIRTYKPHWNFVKSNWIIETSDTAVQVRSKLTRFIDKNDKLFVTTITAPAAWTGFSQKGTAWLKARLAKK